MQQRVRILLLVLGVVMGSSAQATVLAPAEFREIVNGSEIIAFGRVIDATAEMSGDRTRVDTVVTLQVGTYLKGGPGETLVFTVPGGQVGRYRDVTIGAPTFEPGDEAVVFLNARGAGRPSVFGLNQGVYRVRVDEATRRRIVLAPALIARGDSPQRVVRGSPARRSVPLETFGAQVRTVMAGSSARGLR